MLKRGQNLRAYNVGGSKSIQIQELASLITHRFGRGQLSRWDDVEPLSIESGYVPSIKRARDELGLVNRIQLDEAIERTVTWHLLN